MNPQKETNMDKKSSRTSSRSKSTKKISDLVISQEFDGDVVPVTTSLKISEFTNKLHKDVIRAVENLIQSNEFTGRNFTLSEYTDSTGRKLKMYLLDELFTTVLLMGFTGADVIKWKIAYTNEFIRMRKYIAKSTRVIRTEFDEPSDLNRTLNDILLRVRTQMGKETKPHHYMAMAENINEVVFGDRGKNKLLRQKMTKKEYQRLNQALRIHINAILDGNIHKNELLKHLCEKKLFQTTTTTYFQ